MAASNKSLKYSTKIQRQLAKREHNHPTPPRTLATTYPTPNQRHTTNRPVVPPAGSDEWTKELQFETDQPSQAGIVRAGSYRRRRHRRLSHTLAATESLLH